MPRERGLEESGGGSQLFVGLLQVLVEDTDQLWHNHCLRDFKNEKPEEFESWREMYLRLHDAREQRLLMLARNIGSAHANKPKGGAEGRGLGLKPVQFRSCLALCACLCFMVQWCLAEHGGVEAQQRFTARMCRAAEAPPVPRGCSKAREGEAFLVFG